VSGVREVFAAAAAGYDRSNLLLLVERPEMETMLPSLRGKDVLDLGAGTGHYARLARRSGARLAVAFDATPEMLAVAPRPSVVGDAGRLPFATMSADVAIAALLLSYVSDLEATLNEAARVLRDDGVFVASDLHSVASSLGWQRSFTGRHGERLVIDAPPPERCQLEPALVRAGFVVERVSEPKIDERLRSAFAAAGRRDYDRLAGTPLLQIYRARKAPHAG
jgi:ubiquinone/menaquinone biosynthesis C-methylase UbiE